jgi:hypothetical protein
MNQINWNKVKFRASSWGNLLTEPVTKADKENGKLSVTCQKELIKIYNREVYGRVKDITTKQMDKGILAESESIKLLSLVEGELFFKNEEKLENEWFTGHPDLILNKENDTLEVWDIKTSWEMDSFMPKLIEEPDKGYIAQLNCYYSLLEAHGGAIAYCLTSAPASIVETEKRALLFRMNVATEFSPEYVLASQEKLMVFDDIDPRERVIVQRVPKDEELIQKMKDKVPVLRQWLQNFHEKHMSQYPK